MFEILRLIWKKALMALVILNTKIDFQFEFCARSRCEVQFAISESETFALSSPLKLSKWVFLSFGLIWFTEIHLSFIGVVLSNSLWLETIASKSSAYTKLLMSLRVLSRSYMNRRKKWGPRIYLWGSPLLTGSNLERLLFSFTACWLPIKHDFIILMSLPSIPKLPIFLRNWLCGTLSKAFKKSR